MTKRLTDCKVGEQVIVHSFELTEHKAKRLMDMGLLKGTKVVVSRIAPFGDPIAIKLRGFQMSFRRSEAEGIIVRNDTVETR